MWFCFFPLLLMCSCGIVHFCHTQFIWVITFSKIAYNFWLHICFQSVFINNNQLLIDNNFTFHIIKWIGTKSDMWIIFFFYWNHWVFCFTVCNLSLFAEKLLLLKNLGVGPKSIGNNETRVCPMLKDMTYSLFAIFDRNGIRILILTAENLFQ